MQTLDSDTSIQARCPRVLNLNDRNERIQLESPIPKVVITLNMRSGPDFDNLNYGIDHGPRSIVRLALVMYTAPLAVPCALRLLLSNKWNDTSGSIPTICGKKLDREI
ncbi:hypothetical protein GALMADRAFT_1188181 [Galerina marginata CBS 339.88]|uniref:Uncharacterized protein n=1 Tax=Galerina marginata (strain CBS 339.88) TaxID=685588 RepID=A0A067TAT1_GALM3|nr:hypothetical protein GALMADRAFT_1188181 [Galerina marginata CBS 339.88]